MPRAPRRPGLPRYDRRSLSPRVPRVSTTTFPTFSALALASTILLVGGCASVEGPRPSPSESVAAGSAGKPAEVNDTDLHFLAMMTPHHEQAVQMSDIVLATDGVSAETLELAERIRSGQQAEIDTMLGWVRDWGQQGLLIQHSEHIANGMVTPQQMDELAGLDGADAERRFLEEMMFHHEGAIAMTQDQIDQGGYGELRELARQMIEVQSAEVEQMKRMLEA